MRIALGVGGGIAAYKSAEVARALQQLGHEVQVILTRAAQEFIQPLTFAALTNHKVITGLFSQTSAQDTLSSAVEHIAVAKENDALVVAPATADLLAKFAHGLSDDFVSTLYLAFTGQVILAPAMNNAMWQHPATQANIEILRERGCVIIEPDSGWLACGTMGEGRLADPVRIAERVDSLKRQKRDFEGEVLLLTAGPTQEPLDPVRYISNRSSGKMGYALASAAAKRGARVLLISGPVNLPPPHNTEVISVRTASEMRKAVMDHLAEATMIIKNAAVADYYVSSVPQQKLKKTAARVSLELDPTPDILAEIGQLKGDRLLIGFVAETQNLLEEARRKMITKNCDMVVANLVSQEGVGFEADQNEVDMVIRSGQVIHAGPADKREIAEQILDQVAVLRLTIRSVESPV
ncbi:MAG: bifunctional phosphopantothenoylcysteine decarboxylase/phosphopantothenate--cysteine ligase CoaBC [Acidobacteriaceae bacterium]|nr:bifunctional phosphopantothenoylcysteine decarboxylase/phosphopantothenate--cysteine ligase CoaBC [Acidobacteriaceae bacterium]MBV9778723.1 bifunctional phosphopantothenoylcysteine decarboxylase/phosphopantothenate--cysteine ligase CoaBC [Acidobacteriaceae bacterium]